MRTFTIRDIEILTNIKPHTIRIWEQRYSFLKPRRTATNIRYYSVDELKSLLDISVLTKHGFKISQIENLKKDDIQQQIATLASLEAHEDRVLNQLMMLAIDVNPQAFESVLDKYMAEKGMEAAISQSIPLLIDRLRVFWLNNHNTESQQHIISNLLRQKLLAAINALTFAQHSKNSIILFLPESEQYELGLLYVAYLLKRTGIKVLYLGANLPLSDLLSVAKLKSPNHIITHLDLRIPAFEKFLPKYHSQLPGTPLIISSHSTERIFKKPLPETVLRKNFLEMPAFVTTF